MHSPYTIAEPLISSWINHISLNTELFRDWIFFLPYSNSGLP